MRIVAGCDGGGTKCHVQVCLCEEDGTKIRTSEAITGPANVRSTPELALQNIQQAFNEAFLKLELPVSRKIDTIVAALAGAGTEDAQVEWQGKLTEAFSVDDAKVVADAEVLFSAADTNGAAVATIIGTGSIAWARDHAGNLSRAGGLGPAIGDGGSSFWIGKRAIHQFESGGASSRLAEFLGDLDLASLSHRETAQLAPKIFELAQHDEAAETIINDAARNIAMLVVESTQRIPTSPEKPLDWICAGGIALGQPAFLDVVRNNAAESVFLSAPSLVATPVDGAVKLAMNRTFPKRS